MVYTKDLKSRMYQHLFKEGNTQTLNKLNEDRDPVKYPFFNQIKREVEQATNFLPEDIDFNARIYCIENELHKHPTCVYCGKKVTWNKTSKKFPTLCSASCKNYYRSISRIKTEMKQDKHSEPLFNIDTEWKGVRYEYQWKCKHCGTIFTGNSVGRRVPLCPKCFPKEYKGISGIELYITDLLDEYSIKYEKNKRFYIDGGKNKELDVYIPDKNIGIEIDGVYWHSEIRGNTPRSYHIQKNNFFKDYFNIDVIHILDVEMVKYWDIVKSLVLSKLGIFNERIYARKTICEKVNKKEAQDFLKQNHLQQSYLGSTIFYGLRDQNSRLVQVLALGHSRYNTYEYEIHRFASLHSVQIVGGFSKLLNHFVKNYHPKNILSYADKRYSTGKVYRTNGFTYINTSSPNYFYTKDYMNLESRIKYQKHKLHKLINDFNSELSEWENMKNNGFDRIWDCGNMVFGWGVVEENIKNNEKQIDYFHKPEHHEEPRKEGYEYCEICKRNMKSLKGLKKHLSIAHPEIDRKDYYNKYLKSQNESTICPYCGKEKAFSGSGMFYWDTCGDKKCKNKLSSEKIKKHHAKYTKEEWRSVLEKRKQTNLKKYGTEWVMQNKEVKETRKKNNLSKYGVEHFSQTAKWKNQVVGTSRHKK